MTMAEQTATEVTVTSTASACVTATAATAATATPTFKDNVPSFSSNASSDTSSSSSTSAAAMLTSSRPSRSKAATADGTNGLVGSSSSSYYSADSSRDRNATITDALSVLDGQESTTREVNAEEEEEDGESIADQSGHSQYSRSSRRSRRSTRTSATCPSTTRCSTPPPFSPRVGSVVSPGSVRSRVSAILHATNSNSSRQLQCPMSAPVTTSSPSSSRRRSKKKIVFEGLGSGAAEAAAVEAGKDVPPLFALLHGGLDVPRMHSDGAASGGGGDTTTSKTINSRSARMMTMMKPVRVTNKLKGKWPPVVKDDPVLERARRRREAIEKEMQQSSGHNHHTVQQRRVIFELKAKQQQDSLQLQQGSSHEKIDKQKGQKEPTEQENDDDQNENGYVVAAFDALLPEENHRVYDFVLPSGQRLPPPKRKGRKKRRRTNYRISYDGPTLLRLDEVYGPLTEIPEAEAEADDDFDRFENGGDRKGRRHGASCPVPPRRQRSFDHEEIISSDDEEDNDCPLMLPCRPHNESSQSGRDKAPVRPPRRNRSFDTDGDGDGDDDDDDELFQDYDDSTSLTEDESLASVTTPTPPAAAAAAATDCTDDDQSLTEEDLNDSSKRRPDVWITPLMSDDGSRKWKVKRVWDVEEVDDEEPEYEVPHSDLMDSLRELLGVPEDFSAHSAEWDVDNDQFDPFAASAGKDSTPRTPKRAPYYIRKIFDVDGEFDGSEDSLSFDIDEFAATINDIAATAIHDETEEEPSSAPDENEQCTKLEEDALLLEETTTDSIQNQVGDESDKMIYDETEEEPAPAPDENVQCTPIEKSEKDTPSLEKPCMDIIQNQVGDEADKMILNETTSPLSTEAPKSEKSYESTIPEPQPRLSYQERLRIATKQKKDSKVQRKMSVGSSEDRPKKETKYSSTSRSTHTSISFDGRPDYQPKSDWFSPISGSKKKVSKPRHGRPDDSPIVNRKKQQRKQKGSNKNDALVCKTPRKDSLTSQRRPTGKKTAPSQEARNVQQLWIHK